MFNSVTLSAVKLRRNSDANNEPLRGFKKQKSNGIGPNNDIVSAEFDLNEMKRKLKLELNDAQL